MRNAIRTMLGLPAVAAVLLAANAAGAAPLKAAFFDFELVDTSMEGELGGVRADQTARLDRIEGQIRDRLKEAGVDVVDVPTTAKDVQGVKSVRECPTCVQGAATALGADVSVIGFVQKVSNLILNINLEIRDVRTGALIRGGSTDIRGNTDEMWDHGASSLMRNQILKEPLPQEGAQ